MFHIRFYGFLAHTNKNEALKTIRADLHIDPPEPAEPESTIERMQRLTGHDIYFTRGRLRYP